MCTLTFPGDGVQDYATAQRFVGEFLRRNGRDFFGRWIAVPELHPGGHGWHWHILTDRRIPISNVRVRWTRWLGHQGLHPSGGANFVRCDATDFGSGERAARYAAKYVSKKCQVPAGRHRYLMSDTAQALYPLVGMVSANTAPEVLVQLMEWGVGVGPESWLMVADEKSAPDWKGPPLVMVRW